MSDFSWGDYYRSEYEGPDVIDPCPDCGAEEECHCWDEPEFCPNCHRELPER